MSNMFEAKFQSFKLNIFQIHEQIRKKLQEHTFMQLYNLHRNSERGGGQENL